MIIRAGVLDIWAPDPTLAHIRKMHTKTLYILLHFVFILRREGRDFIEACLWENYLLTINLRAFALFKEIKFKMVLGFLGSRIEALPQVHNGSMFEFSTIYEAL
jgi:hypothetical protein